MYDDIGKKIKILSKVLGILSAIGAIIITIEQEWSALFGITTDLGSLWMIFI